MSGNTIQALITAGAGFAGILVARWVLTRGFDGWVRRAAARRTPDEVASMRTRLGVLRRVIVAALVVIVVWNTLAVFPQTEQLATAILASGAVLALFVGLAFTTPLANLGAGVLLALTQPMRIGDRIVVGETAGEVEEITLIHTVLLTDDDRRVFVPNSTLVSSTVVNRTFKDARRPIAVQVPVALGTRIEDARTLLLGAAIATEEPLDDVAVRVTDVTELVTWLTISGLAQPTASPAVVGAEVRERAVTALATRGMLPDVQR